MNTDAKNSINYKSDLFSCPLYLKGEEWEVKKNQIA